jgi:glycosyltransferase involved in cell wall biosynthesis
MSRGEAKDPRVTVLLPVYQGRTFLGEALDSILVQTFRDFELLVVDDGSTDGTAELLDACDDPRLRVIRQDRNRGLVASLNRGLDEARGEIIARMDADDLSLPDRLRRQVDFLDAHPEVGACGAWMRTLGPAQEVQEEYPSRPEDIRCRMLFAPPLPHAASCLRRSLFESHGLRYDPRYLHAEDYDLWRRAAECFPLTNLGEVLYRHRIHETSVCQRHAEVQNRSLARIHRQLLAALHLVPTEAELVLHRGGRFDEPDPPLAEAERWLQRLLDANREHGVYPPQAFERAVGWRWLRAGQRALRQGAAWRHFERSPLTRLVGPRRRLRLALRAGGRALRGVVRSRRAAAPVKESLPPADP